MRTCSIQPRPALHLNGHGELLEREQRFRREFETRTRSNRPGHGTQTRELRYHSARDAHLGRRAWLGLPMSLRA